MKVFNIVLFLHEVIYLLVYWRTIKSAALEETQNDFIEYMIGTLQSSFSKNFLKSIYRAIQEEAKEALKKEKM